MRFGGRHTQAQGSVIKCSGTDPSDAFLNHMQDRKEQVTFRMRGRSVESSADLAGNVPLPSIPFGFRFAENRVNGGFFFSTSFGVRQMQVHSVLHALLDANGRRFEFRRSGLGIHRVNGEIIRRDLLVKMDREKSKPRPQARVKAHGREHRSTS